jgi:hypothetical protein
MNYIVKFDIYIIIFLKYNHKFYDYNLIFINYMF